MDSPNALEWCKKHGACVDAVAWVKRRGFSTMNEAWAKCQLLWWMLWALSNCNLDRAARGALRKFHEIDEDRGLVSGRARCKLLRSLLQPAVEGDDGDARGRLAIFRGARLKRFPSFGKRGGWR